MVRNEHDYNLAVNTMSKRGFHIPLKNRKRMSLKTTEIREFISCKPKFYGFRETKLC